MYQGIAIDGANLPARPPTHPPARLPLPLRLPPPCSPPFLPLAPPQEIPENPEIPEIMESVLFSYRCHHRDNRRHRDGRESGQRRFSEQTLVLEVRHDGEGDDDAVLATKIPSVFPLIQIRPGPRFSPPSGNTCLVNKRPPKNQRHANHGRRGWRPALAVVGVIVVVVVLLSLKNTALRLLLPKNSPRQPQRPDTPLRAETPNALSTSADPRKPTRHSRPLT